MNEAKFRLTDAQIDELKARVDLVDLAQSLGAELRRSGGRLMGSCPLCGGGKKSNRFEIKAGAWMCAACQEGGDALALVQKVRGLDFRAAVEFLGGARQIDSAEAARIARERREREAARAKQAEEFRQRAIASAWRLWHGAGQFPLDPARAYLDARGVALPASADIRAARECPYFHGEFVDERGRKQPRILARAPAMLAAIRDNAGEFIGLHITYLAADWRGKAVISDPDDPTKNLVAKKMRGSKEGGHIVLRQVAEPRRLFIGEGIETVLSVATALRNVRHLRAGDAFWTSGDLGNLGGKAVETVAHPTMKTPAGRVQRVPGSEPDLSAPGIAIPESVAELVLLGDGDSDPFTTRMALERARARFARPGLSVRVAMAPEGRDFNDLLQGVAA